VSGFTQGLKNFLMPGSERQAPVSEARNTSSARPKAPRPSRKGNEVSSIETVTPNSYSEAGIIAEILREGVPVIVNVHNLSDTDTRRLVDFMAGLKAGLMGESKRVSEAVYLLAPYGVEIDADADDVLEAEGDRLIIRP
jgi:cell division inhibitor SepF